MAKQKKRQKKSRKKHSTIEKILLATAAINLMTAIANLINTICK